MKAKIRLKLYWALIAVWNAHRVLSEKIADVNFAVGEFIWDKACAVFPAESVGLDGKLKAN